MLKGCVKLNKDQKKVLLVLACVAFLIFLLSFLEPGYGKICSKTPEGAPPDCASYNVVAYSFWRFVGVTNDYGVAITAFATIFIGIFTWTLYRSSEANVAIAKGSSWHFRLTERAYVQMSHEGGLQFVGDIAALRMQIRNWGNTPARIIRSSQRLDIRGADDPLPEVPEYVFGDNSQSAFLVKDAVMNWPQTFLDPAITAEQARDENVAVRIIGCVEYEDRFYMKHQARYARRYSHGIELAAALRGDGGPHINNLVFEMQAGYNDDVELK